MKRLIIVGAGQMGLAALRSINRRFYTVEALADNDGALQGRTLAGLRVVSVEEAVACAPGGMLIAVAGEARADALEAQIRELGYKGELERIGSYLRKLDMRAAVLALLRERLAAIPGDMAELGVFRGDFAAAMNRLFPERLLYLFDTFAGFDARDVAADAAYSAAGTGDFGGASPAAVLEKMCAPGQVRIREGYFPDTARGLEARFALVSLDADLYAPTLAGLRHFYPRMNAGGVILLHDYYSARFAGVRAAADAFEAERGRLLLAPVGDAHGSVMLLHP